MGRVYLAGPLGFFEAGRWFHREVMVPRLISAGFEVLDPWPNASAIFDVVAAGDAGDSLLRLEEANVSVGSDNASMIRGADWILAVLDGSDVDSGTAAEIGFAAALGIPVIGIRSDLRMSGDNVAAPINLQVLHFVGMSGGRVLSSFELALAALLALGARRYGSD